MDTMHLPADVVGKLEDARSWLRDRDEVVAGCLDDAQFHAGRRVIVARPVAPGRIAVNPAALRELSAEEVAGALVGSLLISPPETCGDESVYADLVVRVERIRDSLAPTA